MIYGGYIITPRVIQESDISVAPPTVREIWAYLLREANSQDNKYNGHIIKRGQLFRSYSDIREGTKWYVGYRKMTYNERQTKGAMKFLRDTLRIYTMKELGGVMITICKYDYYQDPKNYEGTRKQSSERTNAVPTTDRPLPDNNKNDKNNKNKYAFAKPEFLKTFSRWIDYKAARKESYKTDDSLKTCYSKLIKYSSGNPVTAELIIDSAIGSNYAGFFEPKINVFDKNIVQTNVAATMTTNRGE
jgi:hypothetical protein